MLPTCCHGGSVWSVESPFSGEKLRALPSQGTGSRLFWSLLDRLLFGWVPSAQRAGLIHLLTMTPVAFRPFGRLNPCDHS